MVTYKERITDFGNVVVERYNDNGTTSFIPKNEANSDYQAYLESLKPEAKAPKVVDEATPE